MADLYYIESGYFTPDGYYVYTADAESAQVATTTVTATIGSIKQFDANFGSLFTPTFVAEGLKNSTAVLDNQTTISISAEVIRFAQSSLTSTSTSSADVSKTVDFVISATATTTQTSIEQRIRSIDATLVVETTLEANPGAFELAEATATSETTLTVDAVANRSATITQDTIVTLNSQADKILDSISNLVIESNLSSQANVIIDVISTQTIESSVSSSVERIVSVTITTNSLFTPSIQAVAGKNIIAALVSTTTINTIGVTTKNINSSLTSTTTQSTIAVKNAASAINTASVSTFSASLNQQKRFIASATTSSTVNSSVGRIVQGQISLAGVFTPSLTANVSKNLTAALVSSSTISASGKVNKSAQSSIASTSTLSATGIQKYDFYIRFYSSTHQYGSTANVDLDETGNAYLALTKTTSPFTEEIVKLDRYGDIVWARARSNNLSDQITHIVYDDGYLYTNTSERLQKQDANNGNIIWQAGFNQQSDNRQLRNDVIFFDRLGNLYTCGQITGNNVIHISKWNKSDGTLVSRYRINANLSFDQNVPPVFDSQGYLYFATTGANLPTFSSSIILLKIDLTNNSVIWQKYNQRGGTLFSPDRFGLVVDNQDNVYLSYYDPQGDSVPGKYSIVKYNSSGVWQWEKYSNTFGVAPIALYYDSATNRIYVTNQSGTGQLGVAAMDTSGNILWQKLLSQTGSAFTGVGGNYGIKANLTRSALYLRILQDNPDLFAGLAKLPLNGSGQANESNWTYTTSTTPTLTNETSTTGRWFDANFTITSHTGTLANSSTLTYTEQAEEVGVNSTIPVTNTSLWQFGTASLATTTQVSAQVTIRKGTSASLTAPTTLTASAIEIASAQSSLTSTSAISAQAVKRVTAALSVVATSNLTVSAQKIRFAQSSITATTNITATARKQVGTSSSLASTSLISVSSLRIRPGQIQSDSTTIELVAAAKTGQGLIAADVSTTLNIQAVKTTDITSTLASTVTQSTQAVRTGSALVTVDATSSQTTQADRTRDVPAALIAQTDQTVIGTISAVVTASIASDTNLIANNSGIIDYSAVLDSTTTSTATVLRTRPGSSSLTASSNQTTDAQAVIIVSAALDSTTTMSATVDRIRPGTATLEGITVELVSVARVGSGFVAADVTSTLTAEPTVIAVGVTQLESTSSASAISSRTRPFNSTLTVSTDLLGFGVTGVVGESYNSTEVTVLVQAVKTTTTNSSQASTTTLAATAQVIRSATATLNANGGEMIVGRKIRFAQATLASTTTMNTVAGVNLVIINQSLFNQVTLTAQVRAIHIDPYTTWIVAEEDRTRIVSEEVRTRLVEEETRTYIIEGA